MGELKNSSTASQIDADGNFAGGNVSAFYGGGI